MGVEVGGAGQQERWQANCVGSAALREQISVAPHAAHPTLRHCNVAQQRVASEHTPLDTSDTVHASCTDPTSHSGGSSQHNGLHLCCAHGANAHLDGVGTHTVSSGQVPSLQISSRTSGRGVIRGRLQYSTSQHPWTWRHIPLRAVSFVHGVVDAKACDAGHIGSSLQHFFGFS